MPVEKNAYGVGVVYEFKEREKNNNNNNKMNVSLLFQGMSSGGREKKKNTILDIL